MTSHELFSDKHVQKHTSIVTECTISNSIKVLHTQYFYNTDLHSNRYAFKFFNAATNSILDYTLTPAKLFEESFKQQIDAPIDKLTIHQTNLSNLTTEQLHDILDKNISFFTQLKFKKKQIELLNLLN